jgi:hypothetical protein
MIYFAVSQGAQEMFRLLPHMFVEPSELQSLVVPGASMSQVSKLTCAYKHMSKKKSSVNKIIVCQLEKLEIHETCKQSTKVAICCCVIYPVMAVY